MKTINNIFSFIAYSKKQKSKWLSTLLLIIFLHAFNTLIIILTPRLIVVKLESNPYLFDIIILILILQIITFLSVTMLMFFKNKLKIFSSELYRNGYANIGLKQIQIKYQEAVSSENLTKIEAAKYGVWQISFVTDWIEKFSSSIIVMIIDLIIIATLDYHLLLVPLIIELLLVPFYHLLLKIEVDNANRLMPENKIFSWYYRLITDFKIGKDLRIYQANNVINDHCKKTMNRIYEINQISFSKKGAILGVINSLFQLQIVIVMILLIYQYSSKLKISQIVLLFSVITATAHAANQIVEAFNRLKKVDILLKPFMDIIHLNVEKSVRNPIKTTISNPMKTELSFNNVSFTYPKAKKPVLNNISFMLNAGERIAIVGLNGAGKSTIVKLICGFYHPQEGSITYKGKTINDFPTEKWQKKVAVLFQDFRLFPLTLLENITVSSKDISQIRFEYYVNNLGILKLIDTLPNREKTYISPLLSSDYSLLSGGQSQLIGLARTLYKTAEINIFDEPNSSLDLEAEKAFMSIFNQVPVNKISIMISHRLIYTKFVDRILVLDEGQIVASGTHNELLLTSNLYREMYQRQANKYQL